MQSLTILKRNDRYRDFLYSVFALYFIYSTDSLIVSLGTNRMVEYGSYAILGVLSAIFLINIMVRHHGQVLLDLFICLACVFASSLINLDRSLLGLIKSFCLVVGFYAATEMDQKRFIKAFIRMMTLIAVGSLVIYVMKDFLISLNVFPVLTGYKGQRFANFFLANVRVNSTASFRNWGPFWEPGAYQAYLIVALLFLMFEDIDMKHKSLLITIFVITLGTVMSTTGFLAIPFLLTAFLLSGSEHKKFLSLKVAIIIIVTGFMIWFVNSEYFAKIFTDKFELGSELDRFMTVKYGLKLFLQKPIFGYSSLYTAAFHEIVGQSFSITNTYIAHLVVFGLVMGVLSIVLIYRFVRSYNKPFLITFLMFLSLIVSFSGEKMIYCPLFSFMMFYQANRVHGIG